MKEYELSHQKNIRDLGGLITNDGRVIKSGRLFRGGVLNKVTEEDLEILNSFHLTDIIDFRDYDEYKYNGDVQLLGVRYHNFPAIQEHVKKEDRKNDDGNLLWFVGEHEDGFEHMKGQYRTLVTTEKGIKAYKNLFKILEQDNKVVYFHCSQGKDRAGIAAYLIESALGVDMETIKEDYLLSNKAMNKRVEILLKQVQHKPFYNEEYHKSMLDVFSAKMEYLNETIQAINETYGDVHSFLVNVLDVNLDRLKSLYLE